MSEGHSVFPGTGEVAQLMREMDWSKTPLGPTRGWPRSLLTIVRLMLSSRYAMWMGWGPELTFFYNDEYRRQTLGIKHPWALGKPARVVWAEIWDQIEPRIDRVVKDGEATFDEGMLLFLERGGFVEETYHTFSYSPAPDDSGAAGGLFCVVIEETLRVIGDRRMALLRDLAAAFGSPKTVPEALVALEAILTADARDIPFSITYFVDVDAHHATRVAQTGLPRDHAGAPARIVLDDPSAPWPLAAVLEDRTPRVVELPPAGDGSPWPSGPWARRPTHALLVPISQQGQDAPAGVFVAAINPNRPLDDSTTSFVVLLVGQLAAAIANLRAFEEEKRRAEALAEIDRAKTAFFSNVSHELRTPLTLILGPLEDLLHAGATPGDVRAQLEVIHRNGLRLLKLVNTMLDFSRIESGRAQAAYEETDLALFTEDLASNFRSSIEKAKMVLRVDARLREPAFVDRDMWEKIVLNLLSNAVKHTFEGEITVSLHDADDSNEIVFRVADTGTGIPESELPHVFERFHRVRGARSRTHEGTGIGLALVRELVRMHHGTIEVDSVLGRGTTFTVRIPRGRAHLPDASIVASSPLGTAATLARGAEAFAEETRRWSTADAIPEAPTSRASLLPPASAASPTVRILLADDNLDMREYVARLLAPMGEVRVVGDGEAALAAARAWQPDLVLSDVMMPKMDGFELLRALRRDATTQSIPIVLLSARAGEEATIEGLSQGADDYLVKPFSARELVARLRAVLTLRKLRLEVELARGRLRSLLVQVPAPVALLRGAEHTFEFANAAYEAVVGNRHDILGRKVREAFPDSEPFAKLLDQVYSTGERFVGHAIPLKWDPALTGEAKDQYFTFIYEPLRDLDGAIEGIGVVAFDVTEQALAQKTSERLNTLKDEFIATVSHELRTPLNAILGWARMLKTGTVAEDKRERAIDAIERNAVSQAQLIEDLLDMSRITSGKLRMEVQSIDPVRFIEAAVESLRPVVEAKSLQLQMILDPSAGPVSGDPSRLQQVVWNLLSNAAKFTQKGGRILVVLERINSHLEITVQDNGKGIAADFLPYVFDRFRQEEGSISRVQSGLGLGLAISRQLVELHGGTIHAQSPGEGRGSTFTIKLPAGAVRTRPTDHVHPRNSLTEITFERPRELEGAKVLVVDDEEDARELITSILETCGAVVTAVDSSPAALAALDAEAPDVILSDIGMPGDDGYTFMAKVRAHPAYRRIPAAALTAYARAEDRRRALLAGYQMHVPKPVEPAELVAALANLTRFARSLA